MNFLKHPFFKSEDFKKLFTNITNFSILQVTNYLVPLITIPYIVRVIGAERFGIITFAQALIQFALILVDYGFNISSITKISNVNLTNHEKSGVYSSVFYIRIFIMVVTLVLLGILSLFWNELTEYLWVYIFSFGIIPAQILISSWVYNGLEKVKYLNYTNLVSRLIYLICIFIFIKNEENYLWVPLINSVSLFFAGLSSLYFVKTKLDIKLFFPGWGTMKENFLDAWPVFVANFSINLYRNTNIFILGLLVTKDIVGIYAAGEKLVKVLQNIFNPITQTVYPFISRIKSQNIHKSIKAIKVLTFGAGIITLIISFAVYMFSDQVTQIFLGAKFALSRKIIEITVFVLFFGVLNYILGIIFMMNFGMKKQFTQAVICTGFFNLFLCSILTYFYSDIGTAISFISAEAFLFILLVLTIYKYRFMWGGKIA